MTDRAELNEKSAKHQNPDSDTLSQEALKDMWRVYSCSGNANIGIFVPSNLVKGTGPDSVNMNTKPVDGAFTMDLTPAGKGFVREPARLSFSEDHQSIIVDRSMVRPGIKDVSIPIAGGTVDFDSKWGEGAVCSKFNTENTKEHKFNQDVDAISAIILENGSFKDQSSSKTLGEILQREEKDGRMDEFVSNVNQALEGRQPAYKFASAGVHDGDKQFLAALLDMDKTVDSILVHGDSKACETMNDKDLENAAEFISNVLKDRGNFGRDADSQKVKTYAEDAFAQGKGDALLESINEKLSSGMRQENFVSMSKSNETGSRLLEFHKRTEEETDFPE